MEYCEIRLTVPADALEAVGDLLAQADTGGVVIDDDHAAVLRAYLPLDDRFELRLRKLRQELADLVAFFPGMSEMVLQERTVLEQDWANAWREHFHPMRIGRRLVVAPTWEAFCPRPGEVLLTLDPGMAFGTGTHPSTVLCLQALEALVAPDATVLDVGTGSGILAIAAARLGAARVTAIDIDPLAVAIARQNAVSNGVGVTVHHAALEDVLAAGLPPQRVVVANLTADILASLAPELARALAADGTLVLCGIVSSGVRMVEEALGRAGLQVLRSQRLDDWIALWARPAR